MMAVKWAIACMALGALITPGRAGQAEDPAGRHNMMVVGEKTVYASHLPMFDSLNTENTDYTSLHRYQVLLEVTFSKGGRDVTALYAQDRRSHPAVKMYTLQPKAFVLPRLFTPCDRPALNTFVATVFRGHLERGGRPIAGLDNVMVRVQRIVQAEKFDPAVEKPTTLTYLLFGKAQELFLAHLIVHPPDFDQILSVKITGHEFTDAELTRGVRVVFLDKNNTASQRLSHDQPSRGRFHVSGAHEFLDLDVQPGTEFYFEEGELAMPPTFERTPEEKKAGF